MTYTQQQAFARKRRLREAKKQMFLGGEVVFVSPVILAQGTRLCTVRGRIRDIDQFVLEVMRRAGTYLDWHAFRSSYRVMRKLDDPWSEGYVLHHGGVANRERAERMIARLKNHFNLKVWMGSVEHTF